MKKIIPIIGIMFYYISIFSQSIVSVSPNRLSNGIKSSITVTGINTRFMQINTTSYISIMDQFGGSIEVSTYSATNDTSLILNLNIPANAIKGFRDISITDSSYSNHVEHYGKHNAIYIDDLNNTEASIVKLTPAEGQPGQDLEVTITGMNTNFLSFQGVSPTGSLTFTDSKNNTGEINIDAINVYNKDSMILSVNVSQYAFKGFYSLEAAESVSGGDTINYYGKDNAFYVNGPVAPQIISVTPGYTEADNTTDVTIKGKFTRFLRFTTDTFAYIDFVNQFDNNNEFEISDLTVMNDSVMNLSAYADYRANSGFRDW